MSLLSLGVALSWYFSYSVSIDLPEYAWIVSFAVYCTLFVLIQLFLRKKDRIRWTRWQRRSKLEFNTKLGMHSPV